MGSSVSFVISSLFQYIQKNSVLKVLITFFFHLLVLLPVRIDCDSIIGPGLPGRGVPSAQDILDYIRFKVSKSAHPRKLEERKSEEQNVQHSGATAKLEEECSNVIEPGPQERDTTVGHGESENDSTCSVKLAGVRPKLELGEATIFLALPSIGPDEFFWSPFRMTYGLPYFSLTGVFPFLVDLEDDNRVMLDSCINTKSLLIAAECRSLEILDELWKAHCTGFLNEKVQQSLVTEDVLKTFGLTEVKLKATIHEQGYKVCRNRILNQSAGGCTLMENCLTLSVGYDNYARNI